MSADRARAAGLTSTVVFPVGNLAPEGSVIKATAIDPSVIGSSGVFRHRGPARVFTDERQAIAAVKGTEGHAPIAPGDVIVLIGNGPTGTGMQETAQITTALRYLPWGKQVALVTDGRFSGFSSGACVGHVGPEALAGGPIGRVRDGDLIEIIIDRVALTASLSLVGVGGEALDDAAGAVAAGRARPASRPRAAPLAPGRYPPLGGAPAGERRDVGGVRVRRGSHHRGTRRNERREAGSAIAPSRTHIHTAHEDGVKLLRIEGGAVLARGGCHVRLDESWDALMQMDDLRAFLVRQSERLERWGEEPQSLAPVVGQEVWAAGVTYLRSRAARIEESRDAGGGSFYDRVYEAPRPELFFKTQGWRVRGPGAEVRIRRDARWSVPEPEIAICADARGRIVGYTIGNDMSSRDIEGENPLYLPQAKSYDGSCALGPAVLMVETLSPDTRIAMQVQREGAAVFEGETEWSRMKRSPQELLDWLYRETTFPCGCVLLTGTGIVPPDDFTLQPGDTIAISVSGIGTLTNTVGGR